ncbi:hypothetical protein Bca52824_094748 [Brassica carinata]|uniref:Uncharacterized protein n=1 Tax=Brassica carinata TaxID=52824 RepID=A0A8X7P1K1_BRACI|nr:hypothetical protein Bca52824_094748 [Brassica carinata]
MVVIEMNAKAMTLTNLGVFTASNPTSESFIVGGDKSRALSEKETEFLTELMIRRRRRWRDGGGRWRLRHVGDVGVSEGTKLED